MEPKLLSSNLVGLFPSRCHAGDVPPVLISRTVKSIAIDMVQFARANTVSPGYMATEISDFVPIETKNIWRDKIPMGRVSIFSLYFARTDILCRREGEAHELKGAYLYLASDISSYTTGSDIIVDGGYSIV